jgi:hypothetical protein
MYLPGRKAAKILGLHQNTLRKLADDTDKLRSCESTTRKPKLSKTSDLGSTSSGRGLMPFWNKRCQELTSSLWLPTEIDFADSALNSFNLSSNKMVDRSWFSTKILSETGEIKNIGSAKHIKTSIGWINRDLVGARNILLRALVDSPHLFKVTVSKY